MEKNWYSVIRYMPNTARGEILNVGLMLHNPEKGEIKFRILDESNDKLKTFLANEVTYQTYKVQKDFIKYYLENLSLNESLLKPDSYTEKFLADFNFELPNEFSLSEPTYSQINDANAFIDVLMEMYIGKEFLKKNETTLQFNIKRTVKDYFDERKLIGTKVKWNAKLQPIKELNGMHFTIDFVYKNGIINLLQAGPSHKDKLNEWFAKVNTILASYQQESGFYVFCDNKIPMHNDKTFLDMLKYLKAKDERVVHLDINSSAFVDLCNKIEHEGKDIADFEDELTAV